MLRRAAALDERSLARIVTGKATVTGLVRLPFDVLVGRTLPLPADADRHAGDYSVLASELLAWIDGDDARPAPRDADWRGGIPPTTGWKRVDTVPDDVIRRLVRSGARTLKDAAARDGVPGAQPRAEVAAALLDSVVLTVSSSSGEQRRADAPAHQRHYPDGLPAPRLAPGRRHRRSLVSGRGPVRLGICGAARSAVEPWIEVQLAGDQPGLESTCQLRPIRIACCSSRTHTAVFAGRTPSAVEWSRRQHDLSRGHRRRHTAEVDDYHEVVAAPERQSVIR